MNESKPNDIHKVCPLLGAKFDLTTSKVVPAPGTTGLPVTISLTPCQRENCRFWDTQASECVEVLKLTALDSIRASLAGPVLAVRDLVQHLKDKKE